MRVMPPKGGAMPHGHWFSAIRFSAHGFLFSDRINKMDKMTPTKSNGTDSENSVHSVEKSGSDRINKMNKMVSENPKVPDSSNSENSVHSVQASLPNSKKIYVSGKLHPDIRVPFREISLAPTKTMSGEIEVNEPVRVYETSGPWGDVDFAGDVEQGLPALRAKWIRSRCDVDEYEGRQVQPIDDGYLSEKHAAVRNGNAGPARTSRLSVNGSRFQRKPLRAKCGAVTQLAYAKRGIITPEMEFIAIRENGRAALSLLTNNKEPITERNALSQQHAGESFGAAIPKEITPEFVGNEVARGTAIIPA